MNRGFWDKLPKPFMAMAPMADVTDFAYRSIIAKRAKPDVFYTEFVSADGLMHPVGRERLLVDLKYSEIERPIVAQIWSGRPANIEGAARLVRELGFDGVDINMGCPDKGVEKQGGGAGLIRDLDLARQIIDSALEGAGGEIPVSVKTRIGYNSIDHEWLGMLACSGISSFTLHLRTRKEMSKVPAHWELMQDLRETIRFSTASPFLRGLPDRPNPAGGRHSKNSDSFSPPLLIGNGDVRDLEDARQKVKSSGADGAMLGRAIFGNPWLFANLDVKRPSWPEVFETIIEHTELFQETYIDEPTREGKKPYKSFAIMRKFFGAYLSSHPQASQIRAELNLCESADAVKKVLTSYI